MRNTPEHIRESSLSSTSNFIISPQVQTTLSPTPTLASPTPPPALNPSLHIKCTPNSIRLFPFRRCLAKQQNGSFILTPVDWLTQIMRHRLHCARTWKVCVPIRRRLRVSSWNGGSASDIDEKSEDEEGEGGENEIVKFARKQDG